MTNPIIYQAVDVSRFHALARLIGFTFLALAILATVDSSVVVAQGKTEKQSSAEQQQSVSISTHGFGRFPSHQPSIVRKIGWRPKGQQSAACRSPSLN